MQNEDREKFAEIICLIAAPHGREIDEITLEGFWIGLSDLDLGKFQTAAGVALRTLDRMPTVAHLRKFAGELSDEEKALIAFDELSDAVMRYGSNVSVDFEDTTINAVVSHLGGWQYVCGMPESTFDTWLRKDFIESHKRFSAIGVDEYRGGRLIGRRESQGGNFKRVTIGSANPQPRLTAPASEANGLVKGLVDKMRICNATPPRPEQRPTPPPTASQPPTPLTEADRADIDALEKIADRKRQQFGIKNTNGSPQSPRECAATTAEETT